LHELAMPFGMYRLVRFDRTLLVNCRHMWNALPDSVVSASSIDSFWHQLFSLLQQSFCCWHFSEPHKVVFIAYTSYESHLLILKKGMGAITFFSSPWPPNTLSRH